MKKNLLPVIALLSLLAALPAAAQPGSGRWDGDRGSGMMGGGMMGRTITPSVPDKLTAPKSAQWTERLQDVLALERLSQAQYTADADKFSVHMPYMMVIPQEKDHIRAIERLFAAYGLPAASQQMAVTDNKTIADAFQLGLKLEQDLITRYEWLTQNADDRESAAILNEILAQTRQHFFMFERALNMGSIGPMGGGMGRGMMR